MPWMIKADAAHQLGVSLRTLSAQLSEGALESKRDGNRVLVYVPESAEPDIAGQAMPPPAGRFHGAAADLPPHRDVPLIASAMEAVRETRTALEQHARNLRLESEQARQAEQRAENRSRRVTAVSLFAVLVCVAAVAGMGWLFHTRSLAFAGEIAGFRQAMLAAEASMATAETGLDAARAEFREAADRLARDLESMRMALADGQKVAAEEVASLDADLAALQASLTATEHMLFNLDCELEQLAVGQVQFTDDVSVLHERVESVEKLSTLKGLLDRTWDNPSPSQVRPTFPKHP